VSTALRRPTSLALAVLLALSLGLMAKCNPDDSGPGSYDPSSGNHIWYPKKPK
jgi:hypothetical protein